jgi:hypothetical protein
MAGIAAGGEVQREPTAKNVARRRAAARLTAAARYRTALAFYFRGVVIDGVLLCAWLL